MQLVVPNLNQVSINDARVASLEAWDEIWRTCNYATYFHSRKWAEAWVKYSQGTLSLKPLLITFSDGYQALLPMLLQRHYQGLIREHLSCIEGGFGGWISQDALTLDHASQLMQFLKSLGSLTWRLNPYDDLVWQLEPEWTYADETHVIRLDQDFTKLFPKQSSTVRKARKAAKAGVVIETTSNIGDWQEYYQVYRASLKRWGEKTISEYRWDIFQDLLERDPHNIRLWVARYDGKIVSGAICLYAKRSIIYWHGSSLEEYFQVRPVNLLMHTIMKAGYEQGYSWFDFGTSGDLDSVAAFKRSFGASPLPCHVVCQSSPMKQLANKVDYRLQFLRQNLVGRHSK